MLCVIQSRVVRLEKPTLPSSHESSRSWGYILFNLPGRLHNNAREEKWTIIGIEVWAVVMKFYENEFSLWKQLIRSLWRSFIGKRNIKDLSNYIWIQWIGFTESWNVWSIPILYFHMSKLVLNKCKSWKFGWVRGAG